MVILEHLSLSSFLSHEHTELSFREADKLLIDGVSGSGKTSIVEAIVWAIYGKGRVDNRFLVQRGKQKGSVELILRDTETDVLYKILRTITHKSKHDLSVSSSADGKIFNPIGRSGVRDIQDWIETELVGASYLLFTNSIAYIQDNTETFVKQTAAKRKELLLEIVKSHDFDELYKKATTELSAREVSLASLSGQQSAYLSTVATLHSQSLSLPGLLSSLGQKKESLTEKKIDLIRVTREKESIEKALDDNAALSASYALKEREAASLQTELMRLRKEIISGADIKKEIADAHGLITQKETVLAGIKDIGERVRQDTEREWKKNQILATIGSPKDFSKKIAELEAQYKSASKEGESCPAGESCPFAAPHRAHAHWLQEELKQTREEERRTAEDIEGKKSILSSLSVPLIEPAERDFLRVMEEKKERITIAESRLPILEEKQRLISLMADSIPEKEEAFKKLTEEKNSIEQKIKTDSGLHSSLLKLQEIQQQTEKEIGEIENSIAVLNGEIAVAEDAKKRLDETTKTLDIIVLELSRIEKEIAALSAVKSAFGQKGLPAIVVDYIAPRLEEKINDVLSQLSEFRIRIDTQRENSTGDGMVEGLFLTIMNERGEEFDFDSYSGGQKLKITVAIAEALASLQKIGFRIFDEVFFALDEQSTEDFADVMDRLQERFSQVLCITHLRNVKDLFESKISIRRINGVSSVTP